MVVDRVFEAIEALEKVQEPDRITQELVKWTQVLLEAPLVALYEVNDQAQWVRRAFAPSTSGVLLPRRFSLDVPPDLPEQADRIFVYAPPIYEEPPAQVLAQGLGLPALCAYPLAIEDQLRWLWIISLPDLGTDETPGVLDQVSKVVRTLSIPFLKFWIDQVARQRRQWADHVLLHAASLFQAMDEGSIGQRLVAAVQDAAGVDAVFFLRLQEPGRLFAVQAATGVSETFQRLYKVSAQEIQKIEASVRGRFFYVEDLQAEPVGSPRLLQQEDLRSLFAGILKTGNRAVGVLAIASKGEPRAFPEAGKQALMMWTLLGSTLLNHLTELQHHRTQIVAMESVFRITSTLLQVHEFSTFVENVLPMIAETLYAHRISLIREEEGRRFRVYHYDRKTMDFQEHVLNRPQFMSWLDTDEEEFVVLSTGETKGTAYFKKLLDYGQDVWYLWIEGIPEPMDFGLRQDLCEGIAWQVALGLLQVIHAEQERRRREELQFLYDLSLQATSSLNLHETLPQVLQQIRERFAADHVSLFWLDPETQRLVPMGIAGRSIETPDARHGIPVGSGVIGQVAKTGEPRIVDSLQQETDEFPLLRGTQSKLCLPLQARGEIVGVLNLESDEPRHFSDEMLRTLGPLALFLGAFLENTRLFQEAVETLKKLQTTRNKLMESSKLAAIGNLAAGVAHEISNPLMIIQGYTEFHLNDPDIPEALRRDLQRIQEATQRASNIIRSLLEYARSTQEQTVEIVDLNHQILKTVDIVRKAFSKENVELVLDLDPKLPYTRANKGEINQIIMNLLTNARDAIVESGQKGIITIRTYPHRDHLVLEIQDTGPGIPEHLLQEIFDPFFTTKPPGKGTGLGLAIVQRLVEKMNGTIHVESAVGQGTLFRISLPSVRVEAAEAPSAVMTSPEAIPHRPAQRVLVIDDEPDIVDLLRNILETLGQHPVVTSNPTEGLELALTEPFDLILLDVKMPVLSGIDIYERLKQERPDSARRVVFITGDVGREEVRKFLEDERVEYLIKPISIQDIQNVLEHAYKAARRSRR